MVPPLSSSPLCLPILSDSVLIVTEWKNKSKENQIERFPFCENDTPQIERYPSMRTICPGGKDQKVNITAKQPPR